jgi:hypothetical protein
MPNETITLVLSGQVFYEDFAKAVVAWSELIKGIAGQIADSDRVQWELEDAATGSFSGTMRAVYQRVGDELIAERFVQTYTRIGRDLRSRRLSGYAPPIQDASAKIVDLIGERVTSVRFETEIDDSEIFSQPVTDTPRDLKEKSASEERVPIERRDSRRISPGSIRGRVQSIMSRGSLRFTLYDAVSDHPVSCYVQPGKEEMMREAWGKMVLVQGVVRRDSATGLVTSMRDVDRITVLPTGTGGGWRQAIGCAPAKPGEMSPEAAIRRLRDAE